MKAEIIDPVLRVLGYEKETFFSLKREKSLKVINKDLFIDYSMMLWEEDFWIIEAKKVKRKQLTFIASELEQALKYATHPDINAALVVLCDGRLLEIYDREESVTQPVARLEVKTLAEDFHKLQALLSPWQAWFFQKRRVLRLIDKVLDHEINLGRLGEFKNAVDRRLEEKQGKILENWRNVHPVSDNFDARESDLRAMSIRDLVDGEFFLARGQADIDTITKTLAEKARPSAFEVMYQIFPDQPRDMNDRFLGTALCTAIEFEAAGKAVNWIPAWLGGGIQGEGIEGVIKKLISLGLSTFNGDKDRKLVLQYSACVRRLTKIAMALVPMLSRIGQLRHEYLRHTLDELHMAQFMSSPESQNIRQLDALQMMLTTRFIRLCEQDRGEFHAARAETLLKEAWVTERVLLQDGTDYWTGLSGRGLNGEVNPTEHNWVDYDSLGHLFLCVLQHSPKWEEYALQQHRGEIQRLAGNGSWSARKLLGIASDEVILTLTDEEVAQRFFYGDLALFRDLRGAYKNRLR